MADNIDIRLDQLTDAIKGLYAKSSVSQGEIYNALTSLSQRYENLQNISSEKIATTLVNEFRKTIELKYGQTNQYIRDLENALKSFIATSSAQNPKMSSEITKIVQDLSNTYSKLTSQDLALQKIFTLVETQAASTSGLEIAKLSDNFSIFSKNFETIIVTLNKNFADFLEQVKQNSSKEETKALQGEIENIAGNVNSIISAIAIIDSKYKDLTGLIGLIQSKENVFDEALREVKNLRDLIKSIEERTASFNVKQDVEQFNIQLDSKISSFAQEIASKSEVQNQNFNSRTASFLDEVSAKIENIKQEIQKIIDSTNTTEIKNEVLNLSVNVEGVSNNVQNLSGDITGAKDELKNLSISVQNLGGEVKDIRTLINEEVLYKSNQFEADYEKYLNASKEDIKILLVGLEQFKKDIDSINQGNIKILQEPIIRAMEEFKEQDLGQNIKDMNSNLRDISLEIQSSIQNMQSNLANLNTAPSLEILNQMSEAVPAIADKLEIFRNHVVSENSMHLNEIKNVFSQTIQDFKDTLASASQNLEQNNKDTSSQTIDFIKIDLQKFSDYLVDSLEAINEKVQKEFNDFKAEIQQKEVKVDDNFVKVSDDILKVNDKISSLEVALESFNAQALEKIEDNLNNSNNISKETLNAIRADILDCVTNLDTTNRSLLSDFEQKLDRFLKETIGEEQETLEEAKSLKEIVSELDSKVERTNLQQIHNAKELLEEIQSNSSNIETKINALEESKTTQELINAVGKISEKLQNVVDSNDDLYEEFQLTKEDIEQRLNENVQKISAILDKTQELKETEIQNSNFENLDAKVSKQLENSQDFKNNFTKEVKESLKEEFEKIENSIKKIKSLDENSSYTYSLEDVESDLAKIRVAIEKNAQLNAEVKTLFEKVIELRTIGLENVKVNRDIENEIGNLSGWLKDTNIKIDDLSQNVEDVQNNALQEIRSQLIQSEKSKQSANEFYTKIENVLKHVVKTSQNADVKIQDMQKKIGLIMQAQSESFNPSQFIDIFYENMTQTKMLSNRVEIMEDKINSIQNSLDKLISYVEQ